MTSILENFLQGGPLEGVDIIDSHVHMGQCLYMNIPDSDADGLVKRMDELGVDVSCVSHGIGMVSDWKLGNDLLIDAVKKYPNRIWGYTFYNPNYVSQMDYEMKRCYDAGLKGLKIHPDYHKVKVTSKLYEPLFERAQEEQLPLLCHYCFIPGAPQSGSDQYNEIVKRYPNIKYIMAHSIPTKEAVDIAVRHFGDNPNVYFDLSNAIQKGIIEYAAQELGIERLYYGSDGNFGCIDSRLGMICTVDLPEEDLKRILAGNIRELLF